MPQSKSGVNCAVKGLWDVGQGFSKPVSRVGWTQMTHRMRPQVSNPIHAAYCAGRHSAFRIPSCARRYFPRARAVGEHVDGGSLPRGVPRHETANETEPIVLPAFIPTICRPSTSPVGVEPQRDPSNRCR